MSIAALAGVPAAVSPWGWLLRPLAYALVILGIAGAGAYWEHGRMQKKLDAETAAFNQFKGGVEALGMEAAKDAANKDLWNELNRRKTNEENARVAAADQQRIARMRADADRARGGFLSQVRAATRRAEEAEKFGANFERAYRSLVEELRGIGNTGTEAVRDLDSSKDWAAKRNQPGATP